MLYLKSVFYNGYDIESLNNKKNKVVKIINKTQK